MQAETPEDNLEVKKMEVKIIEKSCDLNEIDLNDLRKRIKKRTTEIK